MYENPCLLMISVEKTPLRLWILLVFHIFNFSGAKDNYPEVPGSAIAPLLAEVNFYRNNSHIIKARLEAEKTAAKQRASSISVRLEVKLQKVLTDNILKQIGMLQTKKTDLLSNTNDLGTAVTLHYVDLSCFNIKYALRKKEILNDSMLLFSPAESCNKCRPGWIFLKSACYYFSSQNKSDTKRNWDESRGNCVNQGGDLLVIDSLDEQVGHQPGRVTISALNNKLEIQRSISSIYWMLLL